ncbi:MAG: transketolase, partial [Clostridia bacterium]|nr:transketolase [Clostridia bacterium]
AIMSAPKFKLNNLTAVVDYNKVQLDGTTDEIMPLRDLSAKWHSFGWNIIECEGHDIKQLNAAFDTCEKINDGPSVIIASTIKGKGVSFMEGKAAWHGKPLSDENLAQAIAELGGEN